MNLHDIAGWSPLHYAALKGNASGMQLAEYAPVEARARDGTHPLHYAARHGDDFVKELLRQKASVDVIDTTKRTPLHWAALAKNEAAVKLLVDAHASLSAQDLQEMTPLHLAATTGDRACIKLLVVRADLEAKEQNQRTPVMLAALNGHEDAAELLLEKGADRMAKDTDGRTALHLAALKGNTKVAKILLEKDKSKDLINHVDNRKQTAFHVAISSGHENMVKLLLERGADQNAVNGGSQSALHVACSSGHVSIARLLIEKGDRRIIDAKNEDGRTAVHVAVVQENEELLRLLLKHNADPRIVDGDGDTPLLTVVRWATNDVALAKVLLEYPAEINAQDEEGYTALHHAIDQGIDLLAKLLISKKADVNITTTKRQDMPLHLATKANLPEVVDLLLAAGAHKNARTAKGRTALHLAAKRNNEAILRALLAAGADGTIGDIRGNSPLHLACLSWESECKVIAALLTGDGSPPESRSEDGAARSATAVTARLLHQQNNDGASPLLLACTVGKESYVKFLLEKGVDPNSKNCRGTTPLFAALDAWNGSSNNAGILDLLLLHRAVVTKDEHGWTVEQIAQSKGNWEGLRDLIGKHTSLVSGGPTTPLAMRSPSSWLKHPKARLENNGLDFIYDVSTPTHTPWHEDEALIGANHPFPPQSASACLGSSQEYELFNPKTYFEVRVVNTEDQ